MPLAIMLPLIGHAILLLRAGSDLWPLFVALAAPVGTAYLIVLAVAGRHPPPARAPE